MHSLSLSLLPGVVSCTPVATTVQNAPSLDIAEPHGHKFDDQASSMLNRTGTNLAPGLQYIVVTPECTVFEYAGGAADIQTQTPMDLDTTMMAYSMTKTVTAIAILQLVERGQLGLEDLLDDYVPTTPYRAQGITIRQLLSHTSGLGNPLPLRWVHLEEEAESFNEEDSLYAVLLDNPTLASKPGHKYRYSNLGYWLLGKVVAKVSGQPYTDYVRQNIINPLALEGPGLDFSVAAHSRHAKGYIAKYSIMNWLKPFLLDTKFVGEYEGSWLHVRSHYLNGPAFGGLIGNARGFARLLQDQMRSSSLLLGPEAKKMIVTQQQTDRGRKIPMTLGWHLGGAGVGAFQFKEGGGGGFHCEMRIYPSKGVATVVMSNDAGFSSTKFLNRMDPCFLAGRKYRPSKSLW